METFLKNLPALFVFLTLAVTAWLWGGARGDLLLPVVPWLTVLLVEVLVCFPQRHPHENAVAARRRVGQALAKDPLLYFSLGLLVLLALPFTNPFVPALGEPRLGWAPFCVSPSEHLGVVLWFLPALTAALAAKHALSHAGKRLVVELFAWNGAALAVLGFIERGTHALGPFWCARPITNFFSVFGYPNMGGAFFVLAFAFSVGIWQQHVRDVAAEHVEKEKEGSHSRAVLDRIFRSHYGFVAVALNFFGALCTLSRAAILLLATLAVLAFVYYELSLLFATRHRAQHLKGAVIVAVLGLVCLLAVSVFAPEGLSREMNSVTAVELCNRVTGKAQYHSRVSFAIFRDHPFFGVGGWGYRHFVTDYLTKEELRQVQTVGGANVHNDYLQFLCEHGAFGALLLLGVFIALLVPICGDWYRLDRAAQFMKGEKAPPKPRTVFCLPPGAFWILAGDVAVLIHAFGDCPFRSAATLSALFVSIACATGFVPREVEEKK